MTVSIITCPNCQSTVLPDTVQCPVCNHMLQEEAGSAQPSSPTPAEEIEQVQPPQPVSGQVPGSLISDESAEQQCPSCHEQVRVGLVRCWNCGTFMRDDIAAKYNEMQASSPEVIYSQSPDELEFTTEIPSSEMGSSDEEDDFEIADDIQMIQGPADPITPPEESAETETEESYSVTAPEEQAEETAEEPAAEEAPAEEASSEEAGEEKPEEKETAENSDEEKAESSKKMDQKKLEGSDDDIAHSEATGGDVLLDVALEEEKEHSKLVKKKKKAKPINGFLVFCPNGHRIEVQEKHRGRSGKCPKCQSSFTVPMKKWDDTPKELDVPEVQESGSAEPPEPKIKTVAGKYQVWLEDLRLHVVDPTRLKIKEDSLKSAYSTIDLGLSPKVVLVVDYGLKAGLFGATEKDKLKKKEAREAVWDHINESGDMVELPAKSHHEYKSEDFESIRVVFPIPPEKDSIFAHIPVFGKGMIAVKIPPRAQGKEMEFLSFRLSEFREFAKHMDEMYEITGLGEETPIPLTDEFEDAKCHYNQLNFKILPDATYYQDDPGFDVILVGYRCGNCGIELSEDARKKEKIGGSNGKGIAKAKCPKCKGKMGSHPLYSLANAEEIILRQEMAKSDEAGAEGAEGDVPPEVPDVPEVPE